MNGYGSSSSSSSGSSSDEEDQPMVYWEQVNMARLRREPRQRNANGQVLNGYHEDPQPGPSRPPQWEALVEMVIERLPQGNHRDGMMNGHLELDEPDYEPPYLPLAVPQPEPEPQPGPSRRKRIRLVLNPDRPGRSRSLTLPRRNSEGPPDRSRHLPFPGFHSDGDLLPVNVARQTRRMRRRCFSPGPVIGFRCPSVSPIGSVREFQSYSSSRASSLMDVRKEDELPNDVFYDDEDPPDVLNRTLTWSTFLNYFVIGHLIPNFENARIELSHFWEMTTQEFKDIGITNGRELAILAKIQYSYTGENHYMRR